MRLASDQPAGPIVAVKGSNDAPRWRSRTFHGFVNKKTTFPIFTPKCEKLKSYNFGIVEDTYKLFAPNRGYLGSAMPPFRKIFRKKIKGHVRTVPGNMPVKFEVL